MDPGFDMLLPLAEFFQLTESPIYVSLIWIISLFAIIFSWCVYDGDQLSNFPLVTEKSFWDMSQTKARESFRLDAYGVVQRGFKQVGASKPFRVISELGEMLILPPCLANDVRNNDKLSFTEYMKESMCANMPGFEPFDESTRSTLMADMVKTKLTQALSKLTKPLSDETASACKDVFADTEDWRELVLKDEILDMVARLSASVFLGDEEVRHNASWLQVTKDYTVDSFLAQSELRAYPGFMRPIVHWFLPGAQKIRAQLRKAESIISPVIEVRRIRKANTPADSRQEAERSDSIEWLEQKAQEKNLQYQAAPLQLSLGVSAIHTTTDLLTQTMYEILENPDIVPPLRREIVSVVSDGGLKHSSLYNLRLMDSVIKESQRLKPAMSVNMNRVATGNTQLPDGTPIPKGTKLGVSSHASWDPKVFPNPERFDGFRFLRLRQQPGNENAWQLTTTRPEHIAFGHGKHACPGRFLAANEIKIALCHMLLKYEWKLSPSSKAPRVIANGIMLDSDPTVKVMVRRRQAEAQL